MRKEITLILLSLIINVFGLIAQDRFESKEYGFSIAIPSEWIAASNNDILENLKKMDVSDENLVKMINDHNGSLLLTSFYKYDPKTTAGLIPTIQVNVRANPTPTFDYFESMIVQSAEGFKNHFKDFTYAEEPTVIEVGGMKAVYFIGKFSMPTQNGQTLKVRSRTYAVPKGSYFFQMNFTDGQTKEDCSELFETLVKSIKITE